MFKEFKKFVLRGNVVDLAVAVAVGSAFTAVVNALVKDFLTPLIAAVQGNNSFAEASFFLGKAEFLYGDFLNTLITFIITAAVVFFLVVQPINHLTELARKRQEPSDPTTKICPECLSEVPLKASRCKFCTSRLSSGKKT